MINKNKTLLGVLSFIAVLNFGSCKKEPDIKLIIIDEMILEGVKINFFVGYDPVETFRLIKDNGFELDVVDSTYVFILPQNEFKVLYRDLFQERNQQYINGDSINFNQLKIIRVRYYNKESTFSQEFLDSDFQKKLPEHWLVAPNEQSSNSEKLIFKLKKHSFIK